MGLFHFIYGGLQLLIKVYFNFNSINCVLRSRGPTDLAVGLCRPTG